MIEELIKEINKVEQYFWDRVQSDYLFNNYGSFLYKILNYDQLILQIEKKILEKKISSEFKQYTINRWYNYACSIVVQHYFSEHKRVTVEKNKKSLTKDIYIDNQPFDFKMTFSFKGISETYFSKSLDNPTNLIIKYYKGGGKQRMHNDPKLFIVFADKNDHQKHQWEMKRDFNAISKLLNCYLDQTANSEYLYNKKYKIGDTDHLIKKADLIFMIKNSNHRQGIFFNWKKNEPEKKIIQLD